MKSRGLVFILSIFFLVGCQKETTDPSDNLTDETIFNAIIGPEGGLLGNDAITIAIPEGAFSQNEELNLTTLPDSGCFVDFLSSGRFRLDGLPESYDKPLMVRIAHEAELENESFVVVGEEAINMETGESEIYYEFLDVVDSSGYIICEIPGKDHSDGEASLKSLSGPSAKKSWITVEVVSQYFKSYYNRQDLTYRIYIPDNKNQAFSPKLVEWLDNAYAMAGGILFQGLKPEQIKPFHIYLANLSDNQYCRFAWRNGTEDNSKKPKGILAININKLEDADNMRIMIGREVLRSVLFTFDPKYPRMRPIDQIQHHWLDQALITWSEYLLGSNPYAPQGYSYVPSDFGGHELKPLQGIHAGILQGDGSIVQNITDHGRGMASFIKLIEPLKYSDFLRLTYVAIADGAHPVDALAKYMYLLGESSIDILTFDDMLQIFFMEYLSGRIYSVPGDIFLSSIPEANVFDINGENDTIRIFQNTIPDLSATLFRINLNDPGFGDGGTLEISVTGGSASSEKHAEHLFGYLDGKITLIGSTIVGYDAFKYYNSLIFLFCNQNGSLPYTGNSTLELTVKAKRRKPLQYKYCELILKDITGEQQVELKPAINEPYNSTYNVFNSWKFIGNCNDNSFSGTLDQLSNPDNRKGTIDVTFDEDRNVTSFHMTCYDRFLQEDTLNWEIIGTSIPKTLEIEDYLHHDLTGPQVCTPLQGLYHYSEAPYIPGIYYMYTTLNHSCNESSFISFTFWNNPE